MIKFEYNYLRKKEILTYESRIWNELNRIINKYNIYLEKLGYKINLDKYWIVYKGLMPKIYSKRISFNSASSCNVCVTITENNELICIDTEEGNSLIFDYQIYDISYIYGIFKRIFKPQLQVCIYNDVEKFEEEIKNNVNAAQSYYNKVHLN